MSNIDNMRVKVDELLLSTAKRIIRAAKFIGIGVKPILWAIFGIGIMALVTFLFDRNMPIQAIIIWNLIHFGWWVVWFGAIFQAFIAIYFFERSPELLPNITSLKDRNDRVNNWAFAAVYYLFFSTSLLVHLSFLVCFTFWPYLVLAYIEDNGGTTLKDMVRSGIRRLRSSLRFRGSPMPSPA